EIAQPAQNPVAEAPGHQVVPEVLLSGLEELNQRMSLRVLAKRQWLGRVADEQVREHEARALVGQLLDRHTGVVAELLLLVLGQTFVIETGKLKKREQRTVFQQDDGEFVVHEVDVKQNVLEFLLVPVDVSHQVPKRHHTTSRSKILSLCAESDCEFSSRLRKEAESLSSRSVLSTRKQTP